MLKKYQEEEGIFCSFCEYTDEFPKCEEYDYKRPFRVFCVKFMVANFFFIICLFGQFVICTY